MFAKVLIANRGEIACRIIATCRRLGVATVAVYADTDADAMHVRRADEARRLGPAPTRASYLDMARIIEAAQASGAQAIHPGYGFLSENPQFAQRTAAAGLVFVGPPVAAMQAMSSKATARELMQRSGVPILPGYHGEQQDLVRLHQEAERIGYPILIKPVAGGGGKGMRVVETAAVLEASLEACQREAGASFGDSRVLLEQYLPAPRHIEVQVFGDEAGNIVHLQERDCSAQRRHQKVIEEAPAPGLSPQLRQQLTRSACAAARAVGYTGAGTVEFLLDTDGRFYFIEMNTRIQVEHAVTEMITGIDLVEWQLRIAAAETLPLSQTQIRVTGHAVEARLYAEIPEAGFLPSSGRLRRFELPAATSALRLETGVESGDTVGIDYDPMLAKLIAHAGTRGEAVAALQAALSQVRVSGVGNNLVFVRRLLASAAFLDGGVDTGFIERQLDQLTGTCTAAAMPEELILAAAALWTLEQERRATPPAASPWERRDGWRLNATLKRTLQFDWIAPRVTLAAAASAVNPMSPVNIEYRSDGVWLGVGSAGGAARLQAVGDDQDVFAVRFGDQTARMQIIEDAGELQLGLGIDQYRLRRCDPLQESLTTPLADTNLAAPMPGRIIAQLVHPGQAVIKGTALLIMEAMKMEHTVCAPANGTVRAYRAAVGAQVEEGVQLIDFEQES